jgi:hypothetical protein
MTLSAVAVCAVVLASAADPPAHATSRSPPPAPERPTVDLHLRAAFGAVPPVRRLGIRAGEQLLGQRFIVVCPDAAPVLPRLRLRVPRRCGISRSTGVRVSGTPQPPLRPFASLPRVPRAYARVRAGTPLVERCGPSRRPAPVGKTSEPLSFLVALPSISVCRGRPCLKLSHAVHSG